MHTVYMNLPCQSRTAITRSHTGLPRELAVACRRTSRDLQCPASFENTNINYENGYIVHLRRPLRYAQFRELELPLPACVARPFKVTKAIVARGQTACTRGTGSGKREHTPKRTKDLPSAASASLCCSSRHSPAKTRGGMPSMSDTADFNAFWSGYFGCCSASLWRQLSGAQSSRWTESFENGIADSTGGSCRAFTLRDRRAILVLHGTGPARALSGSIVTARSAASRPEAQSTLLTGESPQARKVGAR